MREHVNIRRAEIPADSPGIAQVYVSSARHHQELAPEWYQVPALPKVVERFSRPLNDDRETIMVADFQGTIAGLVQARILPVPGTDSMIRPMKSSTLDLAILEEYRSMGIGSALLRAGERWAVGRGAERLQLDALAANSRALRLYHEGFGYADFGVILHKRVS